MPRTLPPLRECPGCGRAHRSYRAACSPCIGRMIEEGKVLSMLAAQQRAGRRQETIDRVERVLPVSYNEFPPGF